MKKVLVKYKHKESDTPAWTCTTAPDDKTVEEIVADFRSNAAIEKIYEIKIDYVPYYLDIDIIGEIKKAEMADEGIAAPLVREISHLEDVLFLQSQKNKDKETYSVICAFSAIAAISGIIGLLLSLLL